MSASNSSSLPQGWKMVRIKDIADSIQYGHTARAVARKDGPRFLRITDIQDGGVDWDSVPSCDIPEKDIPKYRLAKGDLVFARTGATTGKSFLIGDCPDAVFASYLIRVRVSIALDSRYLAAFFQSPEYWGQIESGKRGIGQPNVNSKVLGDVQFPLAPLDEQRRIVAEIEKQFTRLDAGVAALKNVQSKLKRYRASVLKAACEGRLVPTEAELARAEGREYESAKVLLGRILTERRAKWNGRGKYSEPASPDTADLPSLREGWVWATVEQLMLLLRNGISTKPDAVSGLPILRISAVRPLSVDVNEIRFLDANATDYADYVLDEGDLLFTRYNGNPDFVGVCGAVPAQSSPLVHPDKLIRCKLVRDLVNPRFVAMMANSGASRAYMAKRVRTTAGQSGISGSDVKGLPIPLPPVVEQERIVAEVERRLSVVEELESTVTANLQRAARLRQAILQKAFSGQLVTQKVQPTVQRPNRHFLRAVLSGEIVHQLHNEPTFGRVKHQKILHLCEYIAELEEIEGEYQRKAAGPMDNKLLFSNENEGKKQKWYVEVKDGNRHFYKPLEKAGEHRKYFERYWPDKAAKIEAVIDLMRNWNTENCEIFSTAYAAWNDLLIWGKAPTEEAILHEIYNRWDDSKKRIPEKKWRKAISWMARKGFAPTGFGKPTAQPE
jgi:type I restriction enzyme S subunit